MTHSVEHALDQEILYDWLIALAIVNGDNPQSALSSGWRGLCDKRFIPHGYSQWG